MLHYIWGGMMLIAIITGAFTGKLEEVASAAMSGAGEAVTMTISLLGVMCLWTGLMKIASQSGLTSIFSKLLHPLTKFLFPGLPKNSPAMEAIVMNMTANLFGMSNAATPLGLNAMKELSKLNHGRAASHAMCMFIVINTASLELVPTTVLALRQAAGSTGSFEIITPVWIASICSIVVGVTAAKLFARKDRFYA
jgi:spore maturation protein A